MINKENKSIKKTSIGGQAVIEGIMMKGPHRTVLAVRAPDNSIIVEDVNASSLREKYKILKTPLIRGVIGFAESMIDGYKTLMRSADLSGMTDLEEEEKKEKAEKKKAKAKHKKHQDNEIEEISDNSLNAENIDNAEKKEEDSESTGWLMNFIMIFATILGFGLAIFLFMWVPSWLFDNIKSVTTNSLEPYRALIEGLMKIFIFIAYIFLVSQTKDIKRVFKYHGAEHKTIFCYENGLELTVENVKKQIRFHPRCGTSFMFLMIAVGIVVSTIVGFIFPVVKTIRILWVSVKILLVPLFCGIGYELIKFCGKHDNTLTRIISAPGLWIQRLTTKEPDDDMMEVAIESIKAVIPENSDDDSL